MLIECLKKLKWAVEHVNPRTNKIMIDQSIETMQVAFRMRLKREGILIDNEMIKMVCGEMIEEEEDDNNLGWGWKIDNPCDDLRISNIVKEGEESLSVVEAEPQFENETFMMKSTIEDDLNDSPNFIQQEQQENEIVTIDDIIETRFTQMIDDYTPENDYEL